MKKSKIISYLLISVILTLGLSISFQSLLADWMAPTSNPPAGGMNEKIISSGHTGDLQSIVGSLGIGEDFTVDIANETFYVDSSNNRVGLGTINPLEAVDVDGNIRFRNTVNCNTGNGNGVLETDSNGNLQCGTDDVNDADSDSSNEIQGVIANQGLRVSSDDFGLINSCSNGQVLKYNAGNWGCADDNTTSSITAANVGSGTFSGDYTFSGDVDSTGEICTDYTCINGGYKLLAASTGQDEETRTTLYQNGTFAVYGVGTHRREVLNSGWDVNLYVRDIVFVVRNSSDDYCVGGTSGTPNLSAGNDGIMPTCYNCVYSGGTRNCASGGQNDWIVMNINGTRRTNCPQISGGSDAALYGYKYWGPMCIYQLNDILTSITIYQVDWSDGLGGWEWEVYYR